jgi:hypothetical protein
LSALLRPFFKGLKPDYARTCERIAIKKGSFALLPIRRLAAEEKRKSANTEIREVVSEDNGDFRLGVQLSARSAALIPASLPPIISKRIELLSLRVP